MSSTSTSTLVSRQDMLQSPWFTAPKNQAHERVFAAISFLEKNQTSASKQHWFNFRLYAGLEASMAATGGAAHRYMGAMPSPTDRAKLTLNIARSCVDTVHAKTIQNKPKPTFLTMGGEASTQRKAKMIDKLSGGIFYHGKYYEASDDVIRDAAALGTGAMKITEDWDGKPRFERTFIEELKVDAAEGLHRRPKILFQYKPVDRYLLLENPKFKKYIPQLKNAGMPSDPDLMVHRSQVADQVAVAEAWRLPSNPYSDDGRHVLCTDNCTLVDEKWEYDYHPFVYMRWNPRLLGFYGQGIPEQISGIQFEVNTLLRKAQEQMRLAGPKVFIERGASIVPSDLNSEIWGVIEYTGTEPHHVVFQSVDPEVFAHIDRLYKRAFDDVGVSQMAAHSEKPAGLNSGRALMAFNDIESARFIAFGQEYERMTLAASAMGLDIARKSHMQPDAEGKKRPFVVKYPQKARGERFLETVSWGDVALANDEFLIQVFPTSLLPSTPIGKLQAVGDMMDRGMLKGDQAIALLDFPDLEKVTGLITAAIDDIDMMIEQMLDEGIALTPEPFSNMELAMERMNSALLRAKVNKYPEDRLELLRMYIGAADAKIKEAVAAAAPPPPPGAPSMATPALPNGMQAPPPPVAGAPGMGP